MQQVSVITLGTLDLARSRRFYCEGFGWAPVFQNDEIVFYQMNGLVLGTYLRAALEIDMNRPAAAMTGAFALAHNVLRQQDVVPLMEALVAAGGAVLRPGGCAFTRGVPGVCRRSRRPRVGDRVESHLLHRRRGAGDVRRVTPQGRGRPMVSLRL